jgi:hypothetical protein
MKSPALFYGAIAIAVIGLLLAIFYVIPGVSHPLTTGNPTAAHYKHAALFAVLAILGVVGALVSRKAIAR